MVDIGASRNRRVVREVTYGLRRWIRGGSWRFDDGYWWPMLLPIASGKIRHDDHGVLRTVMIFFAA